MQDRQPGKPGQYKATLTPAEFQKMQAGQQFTINMIRDDQPIVEGTPYSKAAVLPDALAEIVCPNIANPTPAEAFRAHVLKNNAHNVTADKIGAIPGVAVYYSQETSANDLDVPLALIPVGANSNAGLWRALGSTSFAYVLTLFFSKMDKTANRVQLGFSYNATNTAMAMRRYLNGSWTEWVSVAGTRLELGKEYLTAELYNNKPVYTMLFNGGKVADGVEIDYPGIDADTISVIDSRCTVGRIPIPQKAFGTWGTSSANSYRFASYVVSENSITVSCASSLVGETIYTQIWYTKG